MSERPHSRQCAFNREVIKPQKGHILCDPYPVTAGRYLTTRRRLVNNGRSIPTYIDILGFSELIATKSASEISRCIRVFRECSRVDLTSPAT